MGVSGIACHTDPFGHPEFDASSRQKSRVRLIDVLARIRKVINLLVVVPADACARIGTDSGSAFAEPVASAQFHRHDRYMRSNAEPEDVPAVIDVETLPGFRHPRYGQVEKDSAP